MYLDITVVVSESPEVAISENSKKKSKSCCDTLKDYTPEVVGLIVMRPVSNMESARSMFVPPADALFPNAVA